MDSPTAVIGGTGRVGRLVVRKLLARGEQVRVVGRSARTARRDQGHDQGAEFFRGDVREPDSLAAPLADCSAVVYVVEPGTSEAGPDSPRATMYQGVLNALTAAAAGGAAPHFVLVSQIYVTRKDHSMNSYGRLLDWRLAGEDAVRAAGLPYTVLRPSWLTDGAGESARIHLEQGDTGDGRVSRDAVAEAVVQALHAPEGAGVTFEIYQQPGTELPDWPALFGALRRDPAPAVTR